MEEREHIFNKTSKTVERYVKQLYEDVFNLMTDVTSNHYELVQKENDIIDDILYKKESLPFDIINEKVYEYMNNNRGMAMSFSDDGIKIVKSNDWFSIEEVFVNVYKYILFTNFFEKKNENGYYAIHPLNIDDPDYTFNNIDAFINQIISIYKTSYLNGDNDCYSPEFYMEALINKYAPDYPQYNKLCLYLETLCSLFNQIRHLPELFGEKVGESIKLDYSEEFIKYAFIIRDFLESRSKESETLNRSKNGFIVPTKKEK